MFPILYFHTFSSCTPCYMQLPQPTAAEIDPGCSGSFSQNHCKQWADSNSIIQLGSWKRSVVFGPDWLLLERLWDRCRPLKSCFFLGKKSMEVSWLQWKKHILYVCVCGKVKWYHWSTKKWHGAEHRLFILLNTQAKSYNLCSFKTTLIPKETDYIISLTMNNSTKWIYLMHMNIYHF